MANTKYTSRNFYNDIINGNITDEVKAFAASALQKMDERNKARSSTLTPSQKENAAIAEQILASMVADEIYTAKGIAEQFALKSTQQATAILMKMTAEGVISSKEYSPTGKKKDTVKGYFLPVKA